MTLSQLHHLSKFCISHMWNGVRRSTSLMGLLKVSRETMHTQHSAWCIMGSPRIRAMMTVESVTFVTFLSGMVRRKGAQSLLRPSALLNPCLAGWAVREGSIRVGSWSFIWFFPASEPIIWDFWGLSGRGGFKGPSNQPWFMSKGFQFQKPHHQFLQEKSWTIGADLLTLGLCLRPASENQELSRQSL